MIKVSEANLLQSYAMPVRCNTFPNWLNIPINALVSVVDHTYVTSSQGHTWGCNGRSSGGNLINEGFANPEEADCIYSNDLAGINYLKTGVCHQIANRTLSPAKLTVNKARGYFASLATYGEYGYYQAEWIDRQKQCVISRSYQYDCKRIYLALTMQRIAFRNRFLNEKELSALYPNARSQDRSQLEIITRNWKIKFLSHAIDYHKSNNLKAFQRILHQDLNLFIKSVADIIGTDKVSSLLNLEDYNDNTFIMLFSVDQDVKEEQS